MKDEGVTKRLHPQRQGGLREGHRGPVEGIAREQGIKVLGNDGIDTKAANFRALASKIERRSRRILLRRHHPEQGCPGIQGRQRGEPGHQAVRPRRRRRVPFFEKVGAAIEKQAYITAPTLDPKEIPAGGAGVLQGVQGQVRQGPGAYAIYGYEAMSLALDAIKRAGDNGNDRKAVVERSSRRRAASRCWARTGIDENGDTTLSDYGGNRIKGGKLVFDKVIKARRRNAASRFCNDPPACLRAGREPDRLRAHADGSRVRPPAAGPPGKRVIDFIGAQILWILLGGFLLGRCLSRIRSGRSTTSLTGSRSARSGR